MYPACMRVIEANEIDGRHCTDRQWVECYAQLVGTVLSLWDAAALDAAAEDEEVSPTFINLADASIKMVSGVWNIKLASLTDADRDFADEERKCRAAEECPEYLLCWPESVSLTLQLVSFAGPMDCGDSLDHVRTYVIA